MFNPLNIRHAIELFPDGDEFKEHPLAQISIHYLTAIVAISRILSKIKIYNELT